MISILVLSFITFVGTFGFGLVFNIRNKNLFFSAFGGGLSWFVYSILLHMKLGDLTSLFITSIVFTIYSETLARIFKTPVTTFIICALIPLVPGGGMYYTMLEVVLGNIDKSLQTGLKTLAIAGTLALGIIFVSTITKLIFYYKNNKINKKRLPS